MTRYRYYTATSLDGFLADENNSLNWLFEQDSGEQATPGPSLVDYDTFSATVGALVMGATTYRSILDELKEGDPGMPFSLPWFVFTHQTLAAPAGDITFLQGHPSEHRSRIETVADGRDVWMVGGGGLAADFAEAGMLNDILLTFAPVTLGAGKPLFPRRFNLQLRDQGRSGPFLTAIYDVVGARRDQAVRSCGTTPSDRDGAGTAMATGPQQTCAPGTTGRVVPSSRRYPRWDGPTSEGPADQRLYRDQRATSVCRDDRI
ncbi:dihydrofolate reductase family protein [Actinomycetospora lemnae]|uniref:Dihydrofolate reductase family protein n=1 Tax=Actinomycetospora lemnae TaxID=3019891 RepID=A0ABT5T334_9PSEU|nr:dihydrofolate reductase family protein [Actinomycetospora sp. DW7H6]MDD7969381.1 dihydrofolate reductase family protein [Actinomycetospora sp. DW7H6]